MHTPEPLASSTTVAVLGGAIAATGLAMMGGWIFEVKPIVQVFPGFLMVFNTALAFATAGIALAKAALVPADRRAVRMLAGIALLGIGAMVFVEHALGISLGIDARDLHTWLIDPGRNPWPGRMSPATCMTLVTAGGAFLLASRVRSPVHVLLVRALTFAVAAVGAAAIAGHLLDFSDLFEVYWFKQVSLPIAATFMLLSLTMWLSWQGESWNAVRLVKKEENRIALVGALVLAASIAVAGLTIFRLMQLSIERVLTTDLAFALKSREALIEGAISRAVQATLDVSDRPGLQRAYQDAAKAPADARNRDLMQKVGESLVKSGFQGIAFHDAQGRELARSGKLVEVSELRVPVTAGAHKAAILWDSILLLESRADVVVDGRRLGELRGQQPLRELDNTIADAAGLGATSEFALCVQVGQALQCAPTRFQPRPFAVPVQAGGSRLPMRHALDGESGVLKLTDYRGKRVFAAYSPLGALGVGVVLKTDVTELYAPIRNRLAYLAVILLLASAIGGWLLRKSVQPLVRRLVRGEEQLRMALEGSQLALWDWDVATGKVFHSKQWSAILGGVPQPTETTIEAIFALVHPDDAAQVREQVMSMLRGTVSHYATEHRVRTVGGEWKWIRSRGRVVERLGNGMAVRSIGTNVDIDARKHEQLQVAHRAAHDVLTGLPNRGLFQDRLEQALQRSRRNKTLFALMYIDVDKFKNVNDTLGHAAGDALLKDFAQRLTACVRAIDTVARLGGDEFAVILENVATRDDGLRTADKIVRAMRPAFNFQGNSASVSASVGIAFQDGTTDVLAEALTAAADRALYEAKTAGRDGFRVAA